MYTKGQDFKKTEKHCCRNLCDPATPQVTAQSFALYKRNQY